MYVYQQVLRLQFKKRTFTKNKFWNVVLSLFMVAMAALYGGLFGYVSGQEDEIKEFEKLTKGNNLSVYLFYILGFTSAVRGIIPQYSTLGLFDGEFYRSAKNRIVKINAIKHYITFVNFCFLLTLTFYYSFSPVFSLTDYIEGIAWITIGCTLNYLLRFGFEYRLTWIHNVLVVACISVIILQSILHSFGISLLIFALSPFVFTLVFHRKPIARDQVKTNFFKVDHDFFIPFKLIFGHKNIRKSIRRSFFSRFFLLPYFYFIQTTMDNPGSMNMVIPMVFAPILMQVFIFNFFGILPQLYKNLLMAPAYARQSYQLFIKAALPFILFDLLISLLFITLIKLWVPSVVLPEFIQNSSSYLYWFISSILITLPLAMISSVFLAKKADFKRKNKMGHWATALIFLFSFFSQVWSFNGTPISWHKYVFMVYIVLSCFLFFLSFQYLKHFKFYPLQRLQKQ